MSYEAQLNKAEQFLMSRVDEPFSLREEALIYLVSRGKACDDQIKALKAAWTRDVKQFIVDWQNDQKRMTGIKPDVGRLGGIRGITDTDETFWGGGPVEDAAVLRAAQWCPIDGFDEWWNQLAKINGRLLFQGPPGPAGTLWLFNMCRSDLAISLVRDLLERYLDAIETPHVADVPWRLVHPSSVFADDCDYAARLAFAAASLRPQKHLQSRAVGLILHYQHPCGGWRQWNGFERRKKGQSDAPDVLTTAQCIHALALTQPAGWQEAAQRAAHWLWSQQDESGYWKDRSFDLIYLTVLVLDAIELSNGGTTLTFDIKARPGLAKLDGRAMSENAEAATGARKPIPATKAESHVWWLAEAMLLVRDHPDWSDAEIARRVGKDKSRLSRSREYQAAAGLARGSKADRPQWGYITGDADSGLRDVEALAPATSQPEDKSDRGQPIAGSKYVLEYCAECREPMRVTPDKVGTKPVCEHCEGVLDQKRARQLLKTQHATQRR